MSNAMPPAITFSDDSLDPAVRGWLHTPRAPNGDALILTHGAGSDCTAPLLVALGETFAGHGYVVLRCDLPFRQVRRTGPPFPGNAERDRAGLRHAVAVLRKSVAGRIFLGGHSYGGRQATMFCAAEPELVKPELVKAAPDKSELVAGLLLLSYPLHPPRKPEQLRIQHLPSLRTPSLFVQGTRDPFGSVEENESGRRRSRFGFQREGEGGGTPGKHPCQISEDVYLDRVARTHRSVRPTRCPGLLSARSAFRCKHADKSVRATRATP
jgi:hypothetical protein